MDVLGSGASQQTAVSDEGFDQFAAAWRDWLADITPVVNAVPIPGMPGSFYALTPTCARIDVITERVSAIPTSGLTRRVVVFDRDGLTDLLPPVSDPDPDPNVIRYLITEALRQAANFPVVVVRGDWLLGVVAVQQLHSLLYQLFVEANKPQPPTGPKQWSHKLTEVHRRQLESLPVPQPERVSVEAARQAATKLFLAEAEKIAEANAVEWPLALEQAVLAYLDREGLAIA